MASDVDPDHPGAECYGGEKFDPRVRWLWNSKGEIVGTEDLNGFEPMAVYWDETPQREIVLGTRTEVDPDARAVEYEYVDNHVRKYGGPVLSQ